MFRSNPANLVIRFLLLITVFSWHSGAQQNEVANRAVPTIVKFSGMVSDEAGQPLTGVQGLTFMLYKEETGGAPLWMETQNVQVDASGRYAVMLGSATRIGLPMDLFLNGEARWLGVQVSGQDEKKRTLILSVPYALKAADADTLGGRPASAFLLAPTTGGSSPRNAATTTTTNPITCASGTACKKFFIPKFSSSGGAATVNDSAISQTGSNVSFGGGANFAGNVSTSGNFSANGSVSASTVNTTTPSGGVNAVMTGNANGIAAVTGSATAKGAAGFTFGVIGQSASDQGRGVFGLATGTGGVGVIGETNSTGIGIVGKALPGSNGWSFSATGNTVQDRGSGGWAKALVMVEGAGAPYHILHCFNSTLPGASATTPPCGFNLIERAYAQYAIDFGFEVDDRFWTVSAVPFFVDGNNGAIISDAWAESTNIVQVDLYTDGGDRQTTNFTIVVF